MNKISTEELRQLQVINLCGGELLGYPHDFEIDPGDGKIVSLSVSECSFSLFGKKEEYIIPWCRIECFGEDAILVKIPKNELICGGGSCHRGKRREKCK